MLVFKSVGFLFLIFKIVLSQSVIRPVILLEDAESWETLPDLPGVPDLPSVPVTPSITEINCAAQNFATLGNCCRRKKHSFFSSSTVFKCSGNKDNSFLFNFVSEYVLNKFQRRQDNSIDMREQNMESGALSSAMCFIECVFKTRKMIYKTNTINYDNLMRKFLTVVESSDVEALEAIINTCRMNIEMFTVSKLKLTSSKKCLTKPLFLMQCIRKNLHLTCPSKFLVNSTSCDQKRLDLKMCELF